MEYKKILYTILLITWMIIIFMFSNQPGEASKKTSGKVINTAVDTVSAVTGSKYNKTEKNKIINNSQFVVRKIAHFTLYFILGILVYLTLKSYGTDKRIVIYSILFCLIYSISDEIHQLFSYDRSFKVLDILIDTSGGILSSLTIYKYEISKKSRKSLAF